MARADPLAGEQADQVVGAGNRQAVERHDHVAGEQSGAVRRAARNGLGDGRGRALRQSGRELHAARDRGLLRGYPDESAANPAVTHQLAEHELGRIGGDREADALRALDHGGVHADHLAMRRDERAARIAGIERRIGLDHVVDQAAGARAQRAPERRDDAGRHGRFEAERIADRDHELPAPQPLRVAERRGRERDRRVDAHQRKVGVGIVADDARREAAPLGGHQLDARRAAHHVTVGQHQAVGRDDDARAGARARRIAAVPDVDAHDRRADAVDHVGDRRRIGIEQRGVVGRQRRPGRRGQAR